MRIASLLLLAACGKPDPAGDPAPPTTTSTSSPTLPDDTDEPPPDDTGTPITVPPTVDAVLVLCGGGTEGEIGDPTSWSVHYGDLLRNGDVTGDGLVRVAVVSDGKETDWVPSYFESLGADEAFNLLLDSRAAADAATLDDVDAVFLKGGDQGAYYDLWNDTAFEAAVQAVYDRLGGVGGTSAGAMSLSAMVLAGGADLISADVLEDSHTPYLRDESDGGTGVHADFFALLGAGTLVDTHFSARARLGRLAGTLAEGIDVYAPIDPLGIGLDEQTCITVQRDEATVSGVGSVVFLRPGAESALRVKGEPLVWAGLQLDRLTEGQVFSLATRSVLSAGSAEAILWDGAIPSPSAGAWSADGDRRADEEGFERVVERSPAPFATRAGTGDPLLLGAMAILDAQDSDTRGLSDEAMFRALHDEFAMTGFLVGDGARLRRLDGAGGLVELRGLGSYPQATIVLDATGAVFRSLSPSVSAADAGDGSLHAAGLVGMKLHILYSDGSDGRGWDLDTRAPRIP